MENEIIEIILRVIHLVRTQKFPKNWHFLPADTHKKVRNNSFLENFTYVLNKCFLGVFTRTLSTKSDRESVCCCCCCCCFFTMFFSTVGFTMYLYVGFTFYDKFLSASFHFPLRKWMTNLLNDHDESDHSKGH